MLDPGELSCHSEVGTSHETEEVENARVQLRATAVQQFQALLTYGVQQVCVVRGFLVASCMLDAFAAIIGPIGFWTLLGKVVAATGKSRVHLILCHLRTRPDKLRYSAKQCSRSYKTMWNVNSICQDYLCCEGC